MMTWYDDPNDTPLALLQAESIAAQAEYRRERRGTSGDWVVWAIVALGVVVGTLAGYGAWCLITGIGGR